MHSVKLPTCAFFKVPGRTRLRRYQAPAAAYSAGQAECSSCLQQSTLAKEKPGDEPARKQLHKHRRLHVHERIIRSIVLSTLGVLLEQPNCSIELMGLQMVVGDESNSFEGIPTQLCKTRLDIWWTHDSWNPSEYTITFATDCGQNIPCQVVADVLAISPT